MYSLMQNGVQNWCKWCDTIVDFSVGYIFYISSFSEVSVFLTVVWDNNYSNNLTQSISEQNAPLIYFRSFFVLSKYIMICNMSTEMETL